MKNTATEAMETPNGALPPTPWFLVNFQRASSLPRKKSRPKFDRLQITPHSQTQTPGGPFSSPPLIYSGPSAVLESILSWNRYIDHFSRQVFRQLRTCSQNGFRTELQLSNCSGWSCCYFRLVGRSSAKNIHTNGEL